MRAGRFLDSEAPSVRAAELGRRAGRAELARLALNHAAAAASARGDFERALKHAEAARDSDRAGVALEAESLAARAYALSRLGRHREALDAARAQMALTARAGLPSAVAMAVFDAGSVALAADEHAEAARLLGDALERPDERLPRAVARLRLAEARLGAGDIAGGQREVERFPFEPVSAADLPAALVPRLERIQGLIAATRGDRGLALRRLSDAESGWRRMLDRPSGDDPFAASIVDLGRGPVAGLLEPGVELGRVLAERALLLAEDGCMEAARSALAEAGELAARLRFTGYRDVLERAQAIVSREQAGARI